MSSGAIINTHGCPEFYIDASSIEVLGNNIRLSFGVQRGDHVEGTVSLIMTAEFAVACSKVCQQVSLEAAFRVLQFSEGKLASH